MLLFLNLISSLWIMAASYSSFLSTRFYSPVFNTALFDGPFRIYFSQSYESLALKIYHKIQSDYFNLWLDCKKWTESTKKHFFIVIYPDQQELNVAFNSKLDIKNLLHQVRCKKTDDGFVLGFEQPASDVEFDLLFTELVSNLQNLMQAEQIGVQTQLDLRLFE